MPPPCVSSKNTAYDIALNNPAFRCVASYIAPVWTPAMVVEKRAVLAGAVPEEERARFNVFVDYLAKVVLPAAAARCVQPVQLGLDFRRRLFCPILLSGVADDRLPFQALPSAVADRPADVKASAVLLDVSYAFVSSEHLDECLKNVAAAVDAVGHGELTVALQGWAMMNEDLPVLRRHLLRHRAVAYVVVTNGLSIFLQRSGDADAISTDAEDLRRLIFLHNHHLGDFMVKLLFPDLASNDASERRCICLETHRAYYDSCPAATLLQEAAEAESRRRGEYD